MTVVLGRAILRPIQQLTQSVREIERGNLDLTLSVEEVQALMKPRGPAWPCAFNSMAGRLREFRRSDRAKLLKNPQEGPP